MIELVEQNEQMASLYIEAVDNGFWGSSVKPHDYDEQVSLLKRDFAKWLEYRTDEKKKVKLPTGEEVKRIPSNYYWLIDNGMFVGEIAIRHWLNDFTREYGGHIGYFVRKEMRKKGYGKKMLTLALPYAKSIGLSKVLITAESNNIGSIKIIRANGGVFDSEVKSPFSDNKVGLQRYWIDLI